ncbi:MAG: hypothetical protein QNJ29_05115 [Rhizobiaceae bacterium]|nr:hypothetical protein [Rhizobiaceae bacterium]
MAKFTPAQWERIHSHLDGDEKKYGMPERRSGSLVFSSFNIRKFGKLKSGSKLKRTPGAWKLLLRFAEKCDLLAIQEVGDDLTSVRHMIDELGEKYSFAASDISGGSPGAGGNIERLVYVYRNDKLQPTGLGSDLAYERSDILRTLYDDRESFRSDLIAREGEMATFDAKVALWEQEVAEWEETGLNADGGTKKPRKPSKPAFSITEFLQFIRSPHMVSFKTLENGDADPYRFIAVNAHLLFGGSNTVWKGERLREFKALMDWLIIRADKMERMFEPNFILFGDLNLDFEKTHVKREQMTNYLKSLNQTRLKRAAKINMPFLSVHPDMAEVYRTNARRNQTFDHIAIIASDRRLPPPHKNDEAGQEAPDLFNYGMFDFVQLFFDVLPDETKAGSSKPKYSLFQHDVSDHMPIWIRLENPRVGQALFNWR